MFFFISLSISFLWKGNKPSYQDIKADYEIEMNEQFQLNLVSNPSTGFKWKWINKQEVTVVDSVDYQYIEEDSNMIGCAGKETWTFKGVKKGVDTIKLEYRRPWEKQVSAKTKVIVVRVK